MNQNLRNKYLSSPRYNRYLIATGNNKKKARNLYLANIKIAQAFHPILSQFEVILRNSLNQNLSNFFGDIHWIINQKSGFMSHPSLKNSNYFLKVSIQKTEKQLNQKAIPITSGKVISNQSFGFWTALFLPHHYSLIKGQPIHIFSNKPNSEDRARIYKKLNDIKNFRNRVNHCEPICFKSTNIDCSQAIQIKNNLYDMIEWINPNLKQFFYEMDNIDKNIYQLSKIK